MPHLWPKICRPNIQGSYNTILRTLQVYKNQQPTISVCVTYIKQASHILNNRHEYSPVSNTRLHQHCDRNRQLIHLENLHIQKHHKDGKLIPEQTPHEYNILYDLAMYAGANRSTINTVKHQTFLQSDNSHETVHQATIVELKISCHRM